MPAEREGLQTPAAGSRTAGNWYPQNPPKGTPPVKAALYVRVSTPDQTCALQTPEPSEYVERRGWELAETYRDTMSGAKTSRPGLDRLMADARLRKFDCVLVWKLDRFGRSLVHCVSGIQELSALGIRFISLTQALDTDK